MRQIILIASVRRTNLISDVTPEVNVIDFLPTNKPDLTDYASLRLAVLANDHNSILFSLIDVSQNPFMCHFMLIQTEIGNVLM